MHSFFHKVVSDGARNVSMVAKHQKLVAASLNLRPVSQNTVARPTALCPHKGSDSIVLRNGTHG